MPASSFALVMATGVIAMAAAEFGVPFLPGALGLVNVVAYGVLLVLLAARVVTSGRQVLVELTGHVGGPGFFTLVAATGVLGCQVVALWGRLAVAHALWAVCAGLWFVITYVVFAALTLKRDKPSLADGISGGWLLSVVATQAVAVLGMTIAGSVPLATVEVLHFACLALWAWGGMLYTLTMALIFYRYEFFALSARDLSPPYWISMGAMAISTLAGTLLLAAGETGDWPLLASLTPVIKGATILFWATGTWWIPLLLVLGAWRHLSQHFPLRYETAYWGMVFPLGMYALSTAHLERALGFAFLGDLAQAFLVLAVVAWTVTFGGMLLSIARTALRRARASV